MGGSRTHMADGPFDLLSYYGVKYERAKPPLADHNGRPTNSTGPTDNLPAHQTHLLRLIRDKIYERSYNLTQVFRSFNGSVAGGVVHVDQVVDGLRRMVNLGQGNAKLDG